MGALTSLLRNAEAAGVYCFDPASAPERKEIEVKAARQGLAFFPVAGQGVRSKEQFFDHFARALDFPDYFGGNWDAFEDCLTDLSWRDAPGYVILYENFDTFAAQAPDQFEVALEILNAAVEFWRDQGKPMFVFLMGEGGSEWGLKSPL
ncbi:MAG: barstar family protein [Gammaproteobacteria bacterium]|nr:barstar family protein [Gammaproteobacteria bacterium]